MAPQPDEPFRVPRSRIRRTLPLVTRTSAAVGGQVAHWVRLRRAEDHERLAKELDFHARQAAKYAELLGGMKGAMMKVGQILSFVDASDVVPEPYREVYRTALAQLQADAPPMPPETVAAVVEEELGAPPHELFEWFSPMPMAAASIGQVHAAHLDDGTEVAVKVQYPGVAEAVEADLKNTELIASFLKMGQSLMGKYAPKLDARAVAEEVRAASARNSTTASSSPTSRSSSTASAAIPPPVSRHSSPSARPPASSPWSWSTACATPPQRTSPRSCATSGGQ